MTVLIEGKDVRVVLSPGSSKKLLAVTFTGRDHAPPAAMGAGQEFFEKNDISAVHIISKANHWWLTKEFAPTLDVVRSYADREGYKELITYGSSMGGYGALVGSGRLRANRMVASVPQYSIDPAKAPWEDRWLKDAAKLRFELEDFEKQVGRGDIYIFSDPLYEPDQKHVERIREHRPINHLKVSFAEHDVSRILVELGIISAVTLGAVRGEIDPAGFGRMVRDRRGSSPLLIGGASRLTRRRNKSKATDVLGGRAMEMLLAAPPERLRGEHERLVQGWVEFLIEKRRPEAALSALDRWAEVSRKENWLFQRLRARALYSMGDGARALQAASEALRGRPTERATMNLVADCVRDFATDEQAQAIYREFRDTFMRSGPAAQRLAKALRSAGLDIEADDLEARLSAA
ncbi:tetratricopeptide repeat protein [Phenylobacterium immobile]|uniref:tetratricopeptide repeat protein n=1 Tax=Phenylobacterium immobile TaxID=21 RepID=UPI000B2038CC|nr:hypothetical protein [Phenylobacterium immobile]